MSTPPSPVPPPVTIEQLLRHRPWVRALARRLVGDEGLDDVEQQTWLAALTSPPRAGGSIRGWLATVVRNAARKRHRSASRRTHYEHGAPSAAGSPAPDQVVAEAETQQAVVQAVLALEEPYRTTLLLRFFEDLPPRDVAARMDANVETVRTRTKRGLARLRKDLEGRYGDRRTLRMALIPLAARTGFPPPSGASAPASAPVSASTAAGGTLGVIAMTTGKKLLVAAALVVAVGAGLYAVNDSPPPERTDVAATTDGDTNRVRVRRDRRPDPSGATSETADTTVEAAEDEAAPRLDLEVLARDGLELGRGLAILFAQNGAFRTTQVDGTGRTSIESLAMSGLTLVLAWPGRVPQVRDVPDGAERMSVEVAPGGTVAGRVRIDGRPPDRPVRLALVASGAPWLDRAELPETVWVELQSHGFGTHEVPLATGTGGAFRCATPSVTQTAFIALREGHLRGRDGERTFPTDVPTTVHDLDLVSLPALTGRVVLGDGTPVPAARVSLTYLQDGISGRRQVDTDADGRFLVAAHDLDITTAELTVGALRPGARRVPIEGLRPGLRELGDIALLPERSLWLLVTDPDGRPIENARCRAGRAALQSGTIASGDGAVPRGAFHLTFATSVTHVRVRAPGFAARDVPVPATDIEDWTVRLEPAPRVRVVVPDAPKDVQLHLHLSASASFFDGEDGAFDTLLTASGATEPIEHGHDGAGHWTAQYVMPAGGALDLHGLRPGAVVTYRIEDALGGLHPARPATVPTQGAGDVELPLVGTPRRVVGRVLDPAGQPVQGAEVVLRHPGTQGYCRTVPTLPDGRFDGGVVLSDSVSIVVEHDGYAPAVRADVAVPANGPVETLRLAPGRTVDIEVRDANGALHRADSVEVMRPEGRMPRVRWFAEPGTEVGRHTARDLTHEDLIVLVDLGRRTVTVPCPADAETVRVTLPE